MVVIRPLQGKDWEQFREIRLAAVRENPKAYGLAEADEASKTDGEWEAHCRDAEHGKGTWFVVALSDKGKMVGMLGAVEIFGTYMNHQVEIIRAYVDPKFRQLGIMEKLFLSLKEQLQKAGHIEQMIVWVTLHDEQVGKEMFEKLGFKLAGTLSKTVKFEGKYHDCCWLEASLLSTSCQLG